jgi:hypothetical protein
MKKAVFRPLEMADKTQQRSETLQRSESIKTGFLLAQE